MVALECIENILSVGNDHLVLGEPNEFSKELEENGILQCLEVLADHENVSDDVLGKCEEIITKYFSFN